MLKDYAKLLAERPIIMSEWSEQRMTAHGE
jgi:hypothetical protein